ncbi:MAG: META domain-containing protein [Microcella sp.]|uniref:META domain-containing protein n=1 Tax=Microcella sp. TaxID=1913979 RepID=UPI0024C5B81E|nr:META domain-containing protein [Microcella sp.]UYN84749.1 MAG: META domain-containing protein [Microcella sp.]
MTHARRLTSHARAATARTGGTTTHARTATARTRRATTVVAGIMLVASTALLGGCAGMMNGTSALQGEWVLESGSDAEGTFIDSMRPITLEFDGDSVSGSAPCNQYTGPMTRGPGVDGTGPISFGGLTRTEMACGEQEQNLLENRFFAALEGADSVSVSDDGERLELTGDGVFLSFDRSEKREG